VFQARLEKALVVCERQSGRLSSLLNELLDLTRVRLGRLELVLEKVDLVTVTQEVLERFRAETEQKQMPVSVDLPAQAIGRWDRTRLDQIVTNLISNAIKYGDGKPIAISVASDAGIARFTIRDQGIGIAPEMQSKIFERFERAISSRQITGLGLGLYITRQIVVAHGGTIEVESRPGEGSTFVLTLPLEPTQTQAIPLTASAPVTASAQASMGQEGNPA